MGRLRRIRQGTDKQFQTLNCLMRYAYQAYMISAIY
ncbi:hypothetical protein EL75_3111 [Escherichia coli]|nr:hypothetical protein EL77_2878 [Escherichia coli]KGM68340.1 hypothetical protein EL75_3111 [Escherichia coli]KGM73108.1 hypothetical protein EL78_2921 [Escherichia coli]KGM77887.1 hypothetical protein EL80_3161 [Escherichia coli]KGM80595.1 hypothetical protein EL79_3205 [Escherichia coli]